MAERYKQELGVLIKERRIALGMTQAAFAQKIHVEAQTVSRWERGERGPQDLDAVAKGLETTAAEMLRQVAGLIGQKDRRRLQPTAATQLDRIEQMMAEMLKRLGGDEPPTS